MGSSGGSHVSVLGVSEWGSGMAGREHKGGVDT